MERYSHIILNSGKIFVYKLYLEIFIISKKKIDFFNKKSYINFLTYCSYPPKKNLTIINIHFFFYKNYRRVKTTVILLIN